MPHWLKLQEMTVCFLSYFYGALRDLLPSPQLFPGTFSCKKKLGFPHTRTDLAFLTQNRLLPLLTHILTFPKKLRTLFLLQAHEDRWYLSSLFWENCKKIININIFLKNNYPALDDHRMIKTWKTIFNIHFDKAALRCSLFWLLLNPEARYYREELGWRGAVG